MISIVVLTKNEERNLPGCLESVAWCDDVVVLDSFSTDRTVALAVAAGARVHQRRFTDFADQRNHVHEAGLCRHDWAFHLDADERFTPELREECLAIAARPPERDGYLVAPRMIFMGRWIRRCTDYPAYQTRFVRSRGFRFVQVGHGQREDPAMNVGRLQSDYLHLISSGSFEEWHAKHSRYAREEAALIRSGREPVARLWERIRRGPPLERRRALKRLWFRLPARPLLRFLWQYGLRGGFLDGYAGYCYCRLMSHYEWLIARELAAPARPS